MCTGISLRTTDGSVVVARTVEWALNDAHHDRLVLFPRGKQYTALTPQGATGATWMGRNGFISVTAYGQDYGPDGVNEHGFYVGMYYFPGFASFAPFDPAQSARSLSVGDFMQWMLSSFSSVDEALAHLADVTVVNVDDPRFGGAPLPFHWKLADPSGRCVIIEIIDGGTVHVHEAVLGVVTNSPTYDWHLTNLRTHLGISPAPSTPITLDGVTLTPFGGGSGIRGLPGDYTPPSRFVRATALVAAARQLDTADDAVFEAFRILDSFNITVGVTAPAGHQATDIESATQITTVSDLANRRLYFHTMGNRQVRSIDLAAIDWASVQQQEIAGADDRRQSVVDITPAG